MRENSKSFWRIRLGTGTARLPLHSLGQKQVPNPPLYPRVWDTIPPLMGGSAKSKCKGSGCKREEWKTGGIFDIGLPQIS